MILITSKEFPDTVDMLLNYCVPWDLDPNFLDFERVELTIEQRDWLVSLLSEFYDNAPSEYQHDDLMTRCRKELAAIKKNKLEVYCAKKD